MKKLLLLLVFIAALAFLAAGELDDAISEIFGYSSLSSEYGDLDLSPDDYLEDEDSAAGFLSYACYLWLFVHNGWDLPDSEDLADDVESVDTISAYWLEEDIECVMIIDLEDLYDQFGPYDCDDMDADQVYSAIEDFVDAYAVVDCW